MLQLVTSETPTVSEAEEIHEALTAVRKIEMSSLLPRHAQHAAQAFTDVLERYAEDNPIEGGN